MTEEELELTQPAAYLKWKREKIFSLSVSNFIHKLEDIPITNLSLFCEQVGLNYNEVIAEKRKTEQAGGKECIYHGFKFKWGSIDDVRTILHEHGIPTVRRMGGVTGKAPKNAKDFLKGEYEFKKVLDQFLVG